MSTKYSLARGPQFHLYCEVFDEDNVYLELDGTQFEAGYNRVLLPIPAHIWEVIRRYPSMNLDALPTQKEKMIHTDRPDWDVYATAIRTLATSIGATVYCGPKNNRLKIEISGKSVSSKELAALEVFGDLIELASGFPPGYLERQ